jgi:hypothetical protein
MGALNGRTLNRKWGVGARHALYHHAGEWYRQLHAFPGALFDSNGYILFETEHDFLTCPYLDIAKDVHVPEGLASIPGYVRVVPDPDAPPVEIPSQVGESRTMYEGQPHLVELTRYERDPQARMACIVHYGERCQACDFDFGRVYGPAAAGLIHVHHLTPLSTVGVEYAVDPIRDLRPVCPNCHAVIHSRTPPYTIEEVRRMRREAR